MEFILNELVEMWSAFAVIFMFIFLIFALNFYDDFKYKHDKYYTYRSESDLLHTCHKLRTYDVVAEVLDVKTTVESTNIFPMIYEDLILLIKGEKFVLSNYEFKESDLIYTNNYLRGDQVVVNMVDLKPLNSSLEKSVVLFNDKVAKYIRKPFWKKSWKE